mmetsp:Transcript_95961/g.309844  ORF Transcript_95961/g.309844 Transcript_95961/m.309844 type:complete len:295 (+) Transcript_95961:99-983(+)
MFAWICGRKAPSMRRRCESLATAFTSSRTSGVTRAPCSQSAATATGWRLCTASSNGAWASSAGPAARFRSARASTSARSAVRTLSSPARAFMATRFTAVCAWATSSSSLPSSSKAPSSLLSSPSHSQTRPQTQVILRQPSLRCVGTPQLGQSCACRAFSVCSRSWQVMPRCQEETLQRKQNRSPQQGVRCRGKRCIQASCRASRRSRSDIHGALPLGPKILLSFTGGVPRQRWPQECSSKITCRKSSAWVSARKKRRQASPRRSQTSGASTAKGSRLAPPFTKYEFVSSQAAQR